MPNLERAESLIRQALARSPLNPSAHFAKLRLLCAQRRCEDAIPEYEAVLAFNRNAVPALMGLAICKFLTGSEDEAIPFTEHAIGLSPRAPHIGSRYAWLGFVHLM